MGLKKLIMGEPMPDKIQIRGATDGVLVYVDGLKAPDGSKALERLDPNDIESITVLKDSSAVALYGPDAKSGVILVNTKKK